MRFSTRCESFSVGISVYIICGITTTLLGESFRTKRSGIRLNNGVVTSTFDEIRQSTYAKHKTCGLKIIVDYSFYKFYCGESRASTFNAIVFAITTASSIFGAADFNFDGKRDNIGFTIKEIVLHESTSTQYYLMESNDAITVLDAFAQNNFSGYCMGVLLTYQQFDDGVIGLAFRGSSRTSYPRGYTGGICTGYSFESHMSLNTLIVSTNSYGVPLSTIMFALTLTHELGLIWSSTRRHTRQGMQPSRLPWKLHHVSHSLGQQAKQQKVL